MTKRRKKSSGAHATESFANMMSTAQLNALKPFIQEQVQAATYMAIQSLSRPVLSHVQSVQNSQIALTRILKNAEIMSEDLLAETLMDIEDEATGKSASNEPAAEGDTVRILFKSKLADQEEFQEPEMVQINELNVEKNGNVQTGIKVLEQSIIGVGGGDNIDLTIPAEQEGAVDVHVNVVVKRVSKTEASTNG